MTAAGGTGAEASGNKKKPCSVEESIQYSKVVQKIKMAKVPEVVFYNGVKSPIIGLGTWMIWPKDVDRVLREAVRVGYRHLDCAHKYKNEKEIGDTLAALFKEGVVKREDMFIVSKIKCTYNHPELVESAIRVTLKDLQLDYVDQYLIHWPQTYEEGFDPLEVGVENSKPISVDCVDTWKAMESLVFKGLTKTIGLSNFNKRQIDRVLAVARIKPAVLQIEVTPYLNNCKLIDYCDSLGIRIVAFANLGSPGRPWAKPTDPKLLTDARLKPIADKHGKSVAQILIRYAVERGVIAIPKTSVQSRLGSNFSVFDFKLSPEDMEQISAMECNYRCCTMSDGHHPDYPFHDEY